MEPKAELYIPQVFRNFQGFQVKDIKEWRETEHMELVLEATPDKEHFCSVCGCNQLGMDGRYWLKSNHLRIMGWTVTVCFWREKRYCPNCDKVRSEAIDFICDTTPHITEELAWWITRLTEITSVLAVSVLESIDKKTCYRVDKYILRRLLQDYSIPKITSISVDEVYARGPKQLKEGEDRDDLFLTVIVDSKTHKVIWVSTSRKQKALDEFFILIGKEACSQIKVVATDQHASYAVSVELYAPQAVIVWDRFHLTQKFNEALNEDRKEELRNIDPEGQMGDLMNGKYRYLFLKKQNQRTEEDILHINEVCKLNEKMAKMEMIKEYFHKMFDSRDVGDARVMLAECYQWAWDAKAHNIWHWINSIRNEQRFWNYFEYRVTTGVSEGLNRAIKGLKWQAYGYKDMDYFKLKILQKCGYLNSKSRHTTV